MPKHIAPTPMSKVFTCPFCDVTAVQNWYCNERALPAGGFSSISGYTETPGKYLVPCSNTEISHWAFAECSNCHKLSVWHDEEMVFPLTCPVEEPNQDMPENVKNDYLEAARVFAISPKSSAALLRLGLQKILQDVLGAESSGNISSDINLLKSKALDNHLIMALDTIRINGNEAVHPGTIDLNDKADDVRLLFTIMNMISFAFYTQPKLMQEAYSRLPESKRKIIS